MSLDVSPRSVDFPWVLGVVPVDGALTTFVVTNERDRPVRVRFVTPASYVTVGPQPTKVDPLPRSLPDGREIWLSAVAIAAGQAVEYSVYLDTESRHFPQLGFRNLSLRIGVTAEGVDARPADAGFVVTIGEICDAVPTFSGAIGLDLGTTGTRVVVSPKSRWAPEVLFGASSSVAANGEIPTLISYLDVRASGASASVIGREARARWSGTTAETVVASFRRHIGSERRYRVGTTGGGEPIRVAVARATEDFIAEVKRRILTELEGRVPKEVVCTVPAGFTGPQLQALASALAAPAHAAGPSASAESKYVLGIDSATAAAVFHLHRRFASRESLAAAGLKDGFRVLVLDVGGGGASASAIRVQVDAGGAGDGASPTVAPVEFDEVDEFLGFGAQDPDAGDVPASVPGASPEARCSVLARDGIDAGGGDDATLAVFRLLKAQAAIRLAQIVMGVGAVSDTTKDPRREAAIRVFAARAALDRWIDGGDPIPADRAIGFAGRQGQEIRPEIWDSIDVLLPTRYDGASRPADAASAARAAFIELFQAAETVKVAFGAPSKGAGLPSQVTAPIPRPAYVRPESGALTVVVREHEFRAHVEPSARACVVLAHEILRGGEGATADVFVLTGNASRSPVLRSMFESQFGPFGPTSGRILIVDPDAARAAAATGACRLAAAPDDDGLRWIMESEDAGDVLSGAIGPADDVAGPERTARRAPWFHRGQALPAAESIRLPSDLKSLDAFESRRSDAKGRLLGSFLLRQESGRFRWDGLPEDLAEAVRGLGLAAGGLTSPDGHFDADVVVTTKQSLYLQKDRQWFALWPAPIGPPPERDPFGGRF